MGEGEEVKTRPDPKVEIQEKGEIFFFYRPKVNKEEAHSPDDVQRMYIVMRPESGERLVEEKQSSHSGKEGEKVSQKEKDEKDGDEKDVAKRGGHEGGHGEEEVNIKEKPLLRLAIMGKKSLPDPNKRGHPSWGYIDLVSTNIDNIKAAMKGEEYDTATRGHRHTAAARALAEGIYRILRHQSGRQSHTHLIYKIEFPVLDAEGVSGPQESPLEALNIDHEASFLIQIKNPEQPGGSQFRGLPEKRKAAFPASLQGCFGRKRFSPADPPDFLNYEGCEFLLISASDDIEEELGLELKTECDDDEKCSSDLLQMFGDAASTKPLLSGTWE
ncbi:hypothetical protein LUZ63_006722 [Rhynchospora breviuscula]|uniref:Uncharacterized protein n=1 Tax=Rhynchospora breviuscula TaxID=2022672 RepID=A0A9Q0CQX0_9POAL|nr:hypothetical protein LUZ63_006722 [Rhynchospora breviuscula]